MITPGDISDELIEKAEAECKYNTGEWDCADGKEVAAAILNAAIEAGVVSPPCWAVRDEFGCVVTQRRVFTAKQFAEEIFMHRPGCVAEHWKGQTE